MEKTIIYDRYTSFPLPLTILHTLKIYTIGSTILAALKFIRINLYYSIYSVYDTSDG